MACRHSNEPVVESAKITPHVFALFVDPAMGCREGLDYVVSQAQAFGLKLILTLTNYYVSSVSSHHHQHIPVLSSRVHVI